MNYDFVKHKRPSHSEIVESLKDTTPKILKTSYVNGETDIYKNLTLLN